MEIIYAPGTTVLILITIFVTFYSFFNHKILYRLCLEPSEIITKKRFWQFFTYPFICGNITSLVINCAAIWFFGFALESYMVSVTHFWGHLYFGYYFGFGAVISALLNFLVRRKDTNFILAGSESIALGCALFMLFFDPRVTFYFYFLDEGIPGLIIVGVYALYVVIYGLIKHRGLKDLSPLYIILYTILVAYFFYPATIADVMHWLNN